MEAEAQCMNYHRTRNIKAGVAAGGEGPFLSAGLFCSAVPGQSTQRRR